MKSQTRCGIFIPDTHNIAEPAAAASLAGLIREQEQYEGKNVGVILSGSNVDAPIYQEVMAGKTPVCLVCLFSHGYAFLALLQLPTSNRAV